MKFILVAALMSLSVQVFAQSKMGPEAVEMFNVLTHGQVSDCLQRADVDMVNLEIKKTVFRCPGCNTYTITGNKRNIDTPSAEKTVITIKGKSVPGTFRGWIQTYTCDVK
jgi:hypothetical protein